MSRSGCARSGNAKSHRRDAEDAEKTKSWYLRSFLCELCALCGEFGSLGLRDRRDGRHLVENIVDVSDCFGDRRDASLAVHSGGAGVVGPESQGNIAIVFRQQLLQEVRAGVD